MHVVNDVNSVFAFARRENDFFAHISYVLNAVVARSVNLSNIKASLIFNALAAFALPARATVNRVFAVDGLGKNFRTRSFSRASLTREKVSMRNSF